MTLPSKSYLVDYINAITRIVTAQGNSLRIPLMVEESGVRGTGARMEAVLILRSTRLRRDQLIGYRLGPRWEWIDEGSAERLADIVWLDLENEIEPEDSNVSPGAWSGIRWLCEDEN